MSESTEAAPQSLPSGCILKMDTVLSANKGGQCPFSALCNKVINSLEFQVEKHGKNGIVPFPALYHALSWYHLDKEEAIKVFDGLRDAGYIEIIAYHGIRLKSSVYAEKTAVPGRRMYDPF